MKEYLREKVPCEKRKCFANLSGNCTILTENCIRGDGCCPFEKRRRDVTDGVIYGYNGEIIDDRNGLPIETGYSHTGA